MNVPEVAVIVAVPVATLVANPALLTVATDVADELQLAVVVKFWVEPSLYVPVAVNCCLLPAATELVAGVTAIDLSTGAVPVPERVTTCGLETPLSTIERLPDRVPCALGLSVIEIVQLAAAAKVAGLTGQVLVSL